jgi:hypothetical protein
MRSHCAIIGASDRGPGRPGAREALHVGQLSEIWAAIGLSLSAIGNRADLADSILNQANLAGKRRLA